MEILGYGEDALTLWALKNKASSILEKLGDATSPSDCKILFRPSFGRSGGENSSQFGEFDFILLSKEQLYLGESKWHRSSEIIKSGVLELREEQLDRHKLFKFYVEEWAFGNYTSWSEFEKMATSKLQDRGIHKPIAPDCSLLATNLKTVLNVIKHHFRKHPTIRNVLLYLYYGSLYNPLPKSAGTDFKVVNIDCSESVVDNYVLL